MTGYDCVHHQGECIFMHPVPCMEILLAEARPGRSDGRHQTIVFPAGIFPVRAFPSRDRGGECGGGTSAHSPHPPAPAPWPDSLGCAAPASGDRCRWRRAMGVGHRRRFDVVSPVWQSMLGFQPEEVPPTVGSLFRLGLPALTGETGRGGYGRAGAGQAGKMRVRS